MTYDTDIIGIENDPENGCVGPVDVAHVYLRTVPGRTEGNARLIAAAPELLEALKYIEGVAMADEWRDLPEIAKHARAAIQKAEGKA